jgi:hypothetical protein
MLLKRGLWWQSFDFLIYNQRQPAPASASTVQQASAFFKVLENT